MTASIHTLPNELLLLVFKFVLRELSFRTRHDRASLALVSRLWRDLIYGTPSFWTTIHDEHQGSRNFLALIKSGSQPLDIALTLLPKETREFYGQLCDQSHRWKSARLRVPHSQAVANRLVCPAPLITSINVEATRMLGPEPVVNLFSGEAPRLRTLGLNGFAIYWSSGMLSGLRTLNLRNIRIRSPTVPELLLILKASPKLSTLTLRHIRFQPNILLANLPEVPLTRLTTLEMAWIPRMDLETLLNSIKAPHCPSLSVACHLKPDAELVSIMTAISPFLPPKTQGDLHPALTNKLTIDPGRLSISVQLTPQHRAQFLIDTENVGADTTIRYLVDVLAETIITPDTELALWPGEDGVSALEAANALHITSLAVQSSSWKMDPVVEYFSHEGIFLALRDISIDISAVSPGVLAGMMQARYGHGGSDLLRQLTVGGAKPHHDRDREIVESIIGSDRVFWGRHSLSWMDPAMDM